MVRYYTVEEANALVPWLDSVFQQLHPLRRDMALEQQEAADLVHRSQSNGHGSSEEKIAECHRKVETMKRRADALLAEVEQRGILVRDPDRGLIDFYGKRDGRDIFLCWIGGEPAVEFWHELNTGYAGRQPL